ncbi:DinB family protein [Parapedobacter sp. 2B3]|uniref:DinB family protein n=1 Tax=Parapedobacter sp. 2B3 TaxID=3342381 RepID=UPI0035B57151
MMESVFKFIIDSRKAFAELVDGLSADELNQVPDGFNNNIIWNFGHIVVSTPLLCYVRTGIWPDAAKIKYVEAYKKGTKPTYEVNASELADLKGLAISTIHTLEEDYKNGLFKQMEPFSTITFGAVINTIEELLATTVGHDNTHYGYAIAQRRIIKNSK